MTDGEMVPREVRRDRKTRSLVFVAIAISSRASAAIVTNEMADNAECAVLLSDDPAFDFARVLEIFFPPYRPPSKIHPSAIVAADGALIITADAGSKP